MGHEIIVFPGGCGDLDLSFAKTFQKIMIIAYRKNHLWIWILIAVFLIAVIVLSIILRPDYPVTEKGVEPVSTLIEMRKWA